MAAAIMVNADAMFLSYFQKLFCHSLTRRQALHYDEDENNEEDAETAKEEWILFDNLRTLGWIRKQGLLQQPLGEALHHTILN
jgi:hypothetical protein